MSVLPRKKAGHGWRCPHCKNEMRIRTSETVHPMMRRSFLQCLEVECGATFTVTSEIERQLSPSGTPDPETASVMDELNHRYQKRRSKRTTGARESKNTGKNSTPLFHGVDHIPEKPPLSTLTLTKDAQP